MQTVNKTIQITQEIRHALASINPTVLGKNASRPAPAHVFNGFIAAALGYGNRGAEIARLLKGANQDHDSFSFLTAPTWRNNNTAFKNLQDDLLGVFSPDRRMWEDIGSPLIAHTSMATSDPSDDGFGPIIWDLLNQNIENAEPLLSELLNFSRQPKDPVTTTALILVDGAEINKKRPSPQSNSVWYKNSKNIAPQLLAKSIAEFLESLLANKSGTRLDAIQHLSRGVYFVVVLAILHGASVCMSSKKPKSIHEITPIVTWGDSPPAEANHKISLLSEQSFLKGVSQIREGLVGTLVQIIDTQAIPSKLPKANHPKAKLTAMFSDAGLTSTRLDLAIKAINDSIGLDSKEFGNYNWCQAAIDSSYQESNVTSGLRTMGRKIGFIGPGGGFGAPKFVLETPLLGTLVRGLVPKTGMDFEEFIDKLRTQFGLILGQGTSEKLPEELRPYSSGSTYNLLRTNQERFRRRLIRSGLAREYSDGHTEVADVE